MSEHREKAVEEIRSALGEQEFDFDGLPSRDGLADALDAADRDLERMYFERFTEAVGPAVRSMGPLEDHRGDDWPSIEVDHAVALVLATLSKAQQLMEEGG